MLDWAEEPAFLLDAGEGRIIEANAVAARLLGYRREELAGLAIADLHPFEMEAFGEFAEAVLRKGCHREVGLTCRTREGFFLPADIAATAVTWGGRSCILAVVRERQAEPGCAEEPTATDAGAYQALLDRLATTQYVLDHAPEMVLWVTPEGRVVYANQTAAEGLGFERHELEGMRVWEIDTLSSPEMFPGEVAAFRAARRMRMERRVRTRDGREFPVALTVQLIEHGGAEYLVSFSRDISTELEAKARAQKHFQELARLSRRHSMGHMASAMAHELNQPLTAILNYCGAALRSLRRPDGDPALVAEAVEEARRGGERTRDILRKLQAYVKHGEPQLEPVPAGQLVEDCLVLIRPEAAYYQATLDYKAGTELPTVRADRVLIQQAVLNLVRNALDAMANQPPASRSVTLTALPRDGDVLISVSDTGPGIDAEIARRLFEPFHSSKGDGLGIGLYLARAIAESHGGALWWEEGRRPGATFHLALPVVPSEGAGGG